MDIMYVIFSVFKWLASTSNPYTNYIKSLLCQKGQLHFSHVLEDSLIEKYLVITRKSQIWKIFVLTVQ